MKFNKKYLGQNFLKNQKIAEQIVEVADIKKNDIILEVGPGKGALTELLLQKAKKVIAVEKDKELADFLLDKFKGQKNLSIINGDIFTWKRSFQMETPFPYKIVANIPYYITSRFLRQFLESEYQPSLMVLMVQKEVAERIVAKDGKESLLSISVKVYGKPKIIIKVPAGNFTPKPKVDSAIIKIENISKDFFTKNEIDEKKFFQMLKQGFGHKRKMLKNNLKIGFEILQKCKISALARAEELSLEQWKYLFLCKDRPCTDLHS